LENLSYEVWQRIDYRAALPEMLPSSLVPHLPPGSAVLDAGCNRGGAALFLANQGFDVQGIDINPSAISAARQRAAEGQLTNARFSIADVLDTTLPQFDAVVAIRLLTCLPEPALRADALSRIYAALRPGGVIYIEDFLLTPENQMYAKRYAAGAAAGLGAGNFSVQDASGNLLFVAHHHSMDELELITSRYICLQLQQFEGISMNGNSVNMFEFIGRKPEEEIE
jgi:SAM-dependent methyltransferase